MKLNWTLGQCMITVNSGWTSVLEEWCPQTCVRAHVWHFQDEAGQVTCWMDWGRRFHPRFTIFTLHHVSYPNNSGACCLLHKNLFLSCYPFPVIFFTLMTSRKELLIVAVTLESWNPGLYPRHSVQYSFPKRQGFDFSIYVLPTNLLLSSSYLCIVNFLRCYCYQFLFLSNRPWNQTGW